LSYADDVALLAPTLTAAKVMLNVCEQFANNFNVLFNADKSALLVCGRSIRKEVNLRLNGRIIQQNSTAVHLGTTIGDNSSTRNVKKAASDLYC
jgi:ribosomal protein L18E